MSMTTQQIQGYKTGRLSAEDRSAFLIRRPWTARERRVVLTGFWGRLTIAFEPVLCAAMFLALTVGSLIVRTDPQFPEDHNLVILSPIFALGVLISVAYAVGVILTPTRALIQTFRPIYIVDGYIRYRPIDTDSPVDSNGYVAVLTDAKLVACEWPTLGRIPLRAQQLPAMCEFSEYGGIHKIDGHSTGVLPEKIARFGIGMLSRRDPIE
jgi:hypothetical protein